MLLAVEAWLKEKYGRTLREAIFAEVQVADLTCFESVNAAYATHFVEEPPARVCIQTPLPEGVRIRFRFFLSEAAKVSDGRSGLRVQSISTWAMASIGPYSQARRNGCDGGLLVSSGVLGLVPHSMVLPTTEQALYRPCKRWSKRRATQRTSFRQFLQDDPHHPNNGRLSYGC